MLLLLSTPLWRRLSVVLVYTLCLDVIGHAVILALAQLEASPLAVNVLLFPCMYLFCTVFDINLEVTEHLGIHLSGCVSSSFLCSEHVNNLQGTRI